MNIDRNFGANREIIEKAMNYAILLNMMKRNKEIKILNVTNENKNAVVRLSVNGELYDYTNKTLPVLSKVISENQK